MQLNCKYILGSDVVIASDRTACEATKSSRKSKKTRFTRLGEPGALELPVDPYKTLVLKLTWMSVAPPILANPRIFTVSGPVAFLTFPLLSGGM